MRNSVNKKALAVLMVTAMMLGEAPITSLGAEKTDTVDSLIEQAEKEAVQAGDVSIEAELPTEVVSEEKLQLQEILKEQENNGKVSSKPVGMQADNSEDLWEETELQEEIPEDATLEVIAGEQIQSEESDFVIEDGVLVSYTGKAVDVVVPEEVTSIGKSAFGSGWFIKSIELPEGLKSIGEGAFFQCSFLSSIEIPDGVEDIGSAAFSGCGSLSSVKLPKKLTCIEDRVFAGCKSLSSIELPEGITSIGNYAFSGCSGLNSIELPEGITRIGYGMFEGCSSLSSIELPEDITSIGSYAFSGCSSLNSIKIPKSVGDIGKWAFHDTKWLENKQSQNPLVVVNGILVDGTTCSGAVKIPVGVKYIGDGAFSCCSSLSSIEIPMGVTRIGRSAFWKCSSLSSVNLPEGIKSIEESTFMDCSALTSIRIPSSVTNIGDMAFYFCGNLSKIEYNGKSNVTSIGNFAFSHTTIKEFVIYPGLKWIGGNAFQDCEVLGKISFSGQNNLSYIGGNAFSGTAWYKKQGNGFVILGNTLLGYEGTKKEIKIPKDIKQIGVGAFSQNESIEKIEMQDNVKEILEYGFSSCSHLKEVTIPGSVTKVVYNAFSYCTALENVVIEHGVHEIDKEVFEQCDNLKKIEIPKSVATIGEYAIGYSGWDYDSSSQKWVRTRPDTLPTVYCYSNSAAYQYAIANELPYSILKQQSLAKATVTLSKKEYTYNGKSQEPTVTVKLNNKTLTLGRDYKVSYKNNKNPGTATVTITGIGNYTGSISKTFEITIKDGTTITSNSCKYKIYNDKTATLTSVGENLENVTIPDTVKLGTMSFRVRKVASNVLKNCKKLKTITLPETIIKLEKDSFTDTSKVAVYIEKGGYKYRFDKFRLDGTGSVAVNSPRDKNISSANIPSTVRIAGVNFRITIISKSAFKSCSKLKTVTIGNNVSTLGESCFASCKALTKVTIGTSLNKINKSAFNGDSKLTTITIKSAELKTVGSSIFKGINGKAVIKVPSSKLKQYKKLLKGKGQGSGVKIVKL